MNVLVENSNVPICREHVLKITKCVPCVSRLSGFWDAMPKTVVRPYAGMTGADFNRKVDAAALDNQRKLHEWAVAHLYGDPEVLGNDPF